MRSIRLPRRMPFRAVRTKAAVLLFMLILAAPLWTVFSAEKEGDGPVFEVITVDTTITPPIASYIDRSIQDAVKNSAAGLVILLDTPGGLDLAMRGIIKSILNSPLPVIVYVHPAGARAASAGALITISAHVAAMAPGTNIGAAHPVAVGFGKMDETMTRKVENDAVAYGRGIARKKNRSEDWIERAIRKSESTPAEEALKQKAIDYVASDLNDLLRQMDGKKVSLPSGEVSLNTKSARVNHKKMGIRDSVLKTISDPNIAYLLFLVGLAGLYFEFSNPGAVIPGVVGGISLILAFFALQTLSVNYAGVLLILFAVILFIAEIKVVSHGILTIGGITALVLGSLMLYDAPDPALRVSLGVMIPAVIVMSVFFISVITLALKAQMRRPKTGREGMLGQKGTAVTDVAEDGKVLIQGEYWNAFSRRAVAKGSEIRVVAVDGLRLEIEENK
ncbi:MAG: nodulation protein NfeD [Syntrophales bacterium]|nr:nodulation protein NfeD [Syntrophales bacterium]